MTTTPLKTIYRPGTWESFQAIKTKEQRFLHYALNGTPVVFPVFGERKHLKKGVLLEKDINLIKQTDWCNQGYTVAPFLSDKELYNHLLVGIQGLVGNLLVTLAPELAALGPFQLSQYHHWVRRSEDLHSKVQEILFKGIPIDQLPIPKVLIENRISEMCGTRVSTNSGIINEMFMVRIVRPGSKDNNLPHRDVWLDVYRNSVNIYVPLAGSNALSSLSLIPESHLWDETVIEQGFSGEIDLNMIRPNPQVNEVLVFSPYLIHGGACNWNHDLTRVSLEMRFWPV